MSLTVITGSDQAPFAPLADRTVAVIGFGNQGEAHALNLRDSGATVIIGNRPDTPRARRATAAGFDVRSIEDAAADADLAIVALPDEVHGEVWRGRIQPSLPAGAVVGFLHGFSLHYGHVTPPESYGVVLVAPKGPGPTLRSRFRQGHGIPCLFAVHQAGHRPDDAPSTEAMGLAWAAGIGCARAAIVHTTAAHETETDLFGEQAVLCGGMTELILAAFETLVDAGYPPELAYTECCHEVKQVADLVYERGLSGMMDAISNTAEFGAARTGPVVIDDTVRARLGDILREIRNGTFARAMGNDADAGFKKLRARRNAIRSHDIERAGRTVRAWMPWLTASDPTTPEGDRAGRQPTTP